MQTVLPYPFPLFSITNRKSFRWWSYQLKWVACHKERPIGRERSPTFKRPEKKIKLLTNCQRDEIGNYNVRAVRFYLDINQNSWRELNDWAPSATCYSHQKSGRGVVWGVRETRRTRVWQRHSGGQDKSKLSVEWIHKEGWWEEEWSVARRGDVFE